MGVNKGHYWPEETTDKGPTRINARACAFLKLSIETSYELTIMVPLTPITYTPAQLQEKVTDL